MIIFTSLLISTLLTFRGNNILISFSGGLKWVAINTTQMHTCYLVEYFFCILEVSLFSEVFAIYSKHDDYALQPTDVIVVLKVQMHCGECTKIEGPKSSQKDNRVVLIACNLVLALCTWTQ